MNVNKLKFINYYYIYIMYWIWLFNLLNKKLKLVYLKIYNEWLNWNKLFYHSKLFKNNFEFFGKNLNNVL